MERAPPGAGGVIKWKEERVIMKIKEAMQAYNAQLDTLREQRKALNSILKRQESGLEPELDRVEISKELESLDAQYEAVFQGREAIHETSAAIWNAEAAKGQAEAAAEYGKEIGKIMEVYRRIASGGTVPMEDEKKLMDYSYELYSAAKTAALMAEKNDDKYDSLWEDEEEDTGEKTDPHEVANETEIAVESPEAVAAAAAAELE